MSQPADMKLEAKVNDALSNNSMFRVRNGLVGPAAGEAGGVGRTKEAFEIPVTLLKKR